MRNQYKLIDETGKKFNKLTCIEFNSRENNTTYWLCKCDCGTDVVLDIHSVKSGHTKSCGCIKNPNILNNRYGKLIVAEKLPNNRWRCICDCGGEIILRNGQLSSGSISSCGCSKREDLTDQKFGMYTFVRWDSDKNKKTYWLCRCDCGTEKVVRSQSVKSGETKSCGCYQRKISSERMTIRGKNTKGKNHPSWNHDLTDEDRINHKNRMYCPKTRVWRIKVFKRDNYTCQSCDIKGGKLQAHHIYNYYSHKKLRYVTSNGITLCKICHKEFHHKCGKKHNTRKQLTKFLKSKVPQGFYPEMAEPPT